MVETCRGCCPWRHIGNRHGWRHRFPDWESSYHHRVSCCLIVSTTVTYSHGSANHICSAIAPRSDHSPGYSNQMSGTIQYVNAGTNSSCITITPVLYVHVGWCPAMLLPSCGIILERPRGWRSAHDFGDFILHAVVNECLRIRARGTF